MLTEQLINSLVEALQEDVSEETKRSIKCRIKPFLEQRLKELEASYYEAKEIEERFLQADDRFSRATEEAMAEADALAYELSQTRKLLELLPPDRIIERITTGGVRYDVLP